MSAPEYVRVPCPECRASVRVDADLLGERVTCPECSEDFVARGRAVARPRRDRDDEDEGDDYERRPRPGTCPHCGGRRSTKVTYTWWGGLIGPAIFSLVKCSRCRNQYNRKTGKPVGAVHIMLYTFVPLAVVGGIVLLLALAR